MVTQGRETTDKAPDKDKKMVMAKKNSLGMGNAKSDDWSKTPYIYLEGDREPWHRGGKTFPKDGDVADAIEMLDAATDAELRAVQYTAIEDPDSDSGIVKVEGDGYRVYSASKNIIYGGRVTDNYAVFGIGQMWQEIVKAELHKDLSFHSAFAFKDGGVQGLQLTVDEYDLNSGGKKSKHQSLATMVTSIDQSLANRAGFADFRPDCWNQFQHMLGTSEGLRVYFKSTSNWRQALAAQLIPVWGEAIERARQTREMIEEINRKNLNSKLQDQILDTIYPVVSEEDGKPLTGRKLTARENLRTTFRNVMVKYATETPTGIAFYNTATEIDTHQRRIRRTENYDGWSDAAIRQYGIISGDSNNLITPQVVNVMLAA